jgi:hypothetical protein
MGGLKLSQSRYQLETAVSEVKRLLNKLNEQPDIISDKRASGLIDRALNEYDPLSRSTDTLISQLLSLGTELASVVPRDPNERVSAEEYSLIHKYQALKEYGCTPHTINIIAMSDGGELFIRRRILWDLYKLSNSELQKIISSDTD